MKQRAADMTDENDNIERANLGDESLGDYTQQQPLDIEDAPELTDKQKQQYENRFGNMDNFKDSKFGKVIWKLGDIAKGKGTAGKMLDGILEILPIPNPIRYTKEIGQNKKLKKLKNFEAVRMAADHAGFDFDELIDDSADWVKPTIAITFMVGVFVLVGLGILDVSFLKWLAETVIQSLIGA